MNYAQIFSKDKENSSYIEENISCVFQRLLKDIMIKQPPNIVKQIDFMINWFEQEKYSQNKKEEAQIFKFGNFFSNINSKKLYQQLERMKQIHQQQLNAEENNESKVEQTLQNQKKTEIIPNQIQQNDNEQDSQNSSIHDQQSDKIDDIQSVNQYYEILSKIQVMQHLTEEQLFEVSSKIQAVEFEQGETIIVNGDSMINFYIVVYGTAAALGPIDQIENLEETEKFDESCQLIYLLLLDHKFVQEYETYNYFGQIGLLVSENDQPTVVAKTTIKLLVLNAQDFLELLAPIHNYLLNPELQSQD